MENIWYSFFLYGQILTHWIQYLKKNKIEDFKVVTSITVMSYKKYINLNRKANVTEIKKKTDKSKKF